MMKGERIRKGELKFPVILWKKEGIFRLQTSCFVVITPYSGSWMDDVSAGLDVLERRKRSAPVRNPNRGVRSGPVRSPH
jgi:hypothetical protein